MLWLLAFGLTVPAFAVLAVAWIASQLEGRRARRRLLGVLEGLGAPVPSKELGGLTPRSVATLEGTLQTEAEPGAVSFHPFGTSFLEEPNVYAVSESPRADLVLELDGGGRALLEGPVQVLAGSSESEHGAPLAKAAAFGAVELGASAIRKRVGQFRSVRRGDRVRVRGAVEPAPDDEAHYRDRSNVVRVSPIADAPNAIVLAAVRPAAMKRLVPRRALAATVLAAAALGGLTFPLTLRTPRRPPIAPLPVASSACRAGALAALEKGTKPEPCADPYARAMEHFASGAFSEASAAFAEAVAKEPMLQPSLSEAESHLFAHDYARAAETTHRMVTAFYGGPSTAEKRYLECIAERLDERAAMANGAQGPYAMTRSGDLYRKICSPRAFAKLARELDAEGAFWGEEDWLEFSSGTYRSPAAYDVVAQPFTAVVAPRARLAGRPIAIERSVLDRLVVGSAPTKKPQALGDYGRLALFRHHEADFYPLVAAYAAELTLFYAHAGVPERSQPYWPILDRVAATLEANKSFHVVETTFAWEKTMLEDERTLLEFVLSVASASAIHSGDATRATRYAKLGEVHSAALAKQMLRALDPAAPWEEPTEDGRWPDRELVFAASRSGDAAAVARQLTEQRATGREVLPRILPRLTRNREALQALFDKGFATPCLTCGASTYLGHVADRREVARLLGSSAEADRLAPIVTRFVDAYTDAAIAFELDELETFFGRKGS